MAGTKEGALKAWETMRAKGINPAAKRKGKPLTEKQKAALQKAKAVKARKKKPE